MIQQRPRALHASLGKKEEGKICSPQRFFRCATPHWFVLHWSPFALLSWRMELEAPFGRQWRRIWPRCHGAAAGSKANTGAPVLRASLLPNEEERPGLQACDSGTAPNSGEVEAHVFL